LSAIPALVQVRPAVAALVLAMPVVRPEEPALPMYYPMCLELAAPLAAHACSNRALADLPPYLLLLNPAIPMSAPALPAPVALPRERAPQAPQL